MLHLQSQVLFVPAQDLENTGEPDETAGHCRDQSATAASGDTRSAELEPCYRTATVRESVPETDILKKILSKRIALISSFPSAYECF
jgi:hypothetical protein